MLECDESIAGHFKEPIMQPLKRGEFRDMVSAELEHARCKHGDIHSLHEGYAVILEELDELKAIVWDRHNSELHDSALSELVQIAAMAQRCAEDVLGWYRPKVCRTQSA